MNNFCGQGCSSYVTEKSSLEEAVLCLEKSSCSSSCTISDPLCPRRWVGCVREEHGRCGADVAVLLCTGKAPLLCSSSPLKPGMKCLQSCWRCKCWVAPMLLWELGVLQAFSWNFAGMDKAAWGSFCSMLCALLLHTPSGEVTVWLVSQGMPFP